jgi:hypothetical protein
MNRHSIRNPQSASRADELSRRDWMRMAAGGVLTGCVSGWFDLLAGRAAASAAQGSKPKSCLLLWCDGGPSSAHTFDPKPEDSRVACQAIDTSVPGIRISENLPHVAKHMQKLAVLRSMHSRDAQHGPGHYEMRTGYRKGLGGVTFPHMGAIVGSERGRPDSVIPNYVILGNGYLYEPMWGTGPGYLGPAHAPLRLKEPSGGVPDLQTAGAIPNLSVRAALLQKLDREFQQERPAASVEAHQVGYQQALQLVHSDKILKALKLEAEPDKTRTAYGESVFGNRCLAARRLIEAGGLFVEVNLSNGSSFYWDTHGGGPKGQKKMCEATDQPMAALLTDLQERGLLDTTLVIWMGEFGRDITGNDHYGHCWTTALAGAGLKTGQVIGKSQANKTGGRSLTIADGPEITPPDFMATVLSALGIDPAKNNVVQSRPLSLAAEGARPVKEILPG